MWGRFVRFRVPIAFRVSKLLSSLHEHHDCGNRQRYHIPFKSFHRSSPPPSITDIIYYMYMVLYTCSNASIFQHTWLYPSQQDVTPVNYLLSRFRYPDLTNMCVDCRTHQQLWQLCPLIISHLGTCSDRDHRSGTQGFFLQQVFEPLVSFSSFMLVNVLNLDLELRRSSFVLY